MLRILHKIIKYSIKQWNNTHSDILHKYIFHAVPISDGRDSIGVIIPVEGKENEFVVTSDRFIYKLHWDPQSDNETTLEEIHFVDEDKPKINSTMAKLTPKEDFGLVR